MSNSLAIATVTAALKLHLMESFEVDSTAVTTLRPGSTGIPTETPGINIYLYRTEPNPSLSNTGLPSRDRDGRFVEPPVTSLDLHYLISFHGDHATFIPERLLGSTSSYLTTYPILSKDLLKRAIQLAENGLADSDLDDQAEAIKLTPASIGLEELAEVWSAFQTPYLLSRAYKASVVLMQEPVDERTPLPVLRREFGFSLFERPLIESVVVVDADSITLGGTIELRGSQLLGSRQLDQVLVRVSDLELEAEVAPISANAVRVVLDSVLASSLRAGVQSVQLLLRSSEFPDDIESNLFSFVLRPSVVSTELDEDDNDIEIEVEPMIGVDQKVQVLLNQDIEEDPSFYTLLAQPITAESTTVRVSASGVDPGDYLTRLSVDGAQSPLDHDIDGFTGPIISVPVPEP